MQRPSTSSPSVSKSIKESNDLVELLENNNFREKFFKKRSSEIYKKKQRKELANDDRERSYN